MARKKSSAPDETIEEVYDRIEAADDIPPMPEKGPMGDLTPDVVEWFRLYRPEEYTALYIRPGHHKGPRIPIR